MSRVLCRFHVPVGRAPRCAVGTPFTRALSQAPDVAVPGDGQPSLSLSYLIQSCELSPEAALDASKNVRLTTTNNPDSVLRLLGDYGCSGSHVAAAIAKHPELLMRSEKTLKPKLEFLRGVGISGTHLQAILSANPRLLLHSLKKKIAPSVGFLKGLLVSVDAVADALRLSSRLFPETQVVNVQTLRRHGVSEAGISKLLVSRPLTLARSPERFEEVVTTLKEGMGLDPNKPMFIHAVRVMTYMAKETWERKVAMYRSVGWSDEDITSAFGRQPNYLAVSDEGICQKTEFFATKLGLRASAICRNPGLMTMSLGKRVAPRCAVLKMLMARGALQRPTSLVSVLTIPPGAFLERFVNRHKDRVPEVVDAHQGKVEFDGFGDLSRLVKLDSRRR